MVSFCIPARPECPGGKPSASDGAFRKRVGQDDADGAGSCRISHRIADKKTRLFLLSRLKTFLMRFIVFVDDFSLIKGLKRNDGGYATGNHCNAHTRIRGKDPLCSVRASPFSGSNGFPRDRRHFAIKQTVIRRRNDYGYQSLHRQDLLRVRRDADAGPADQVHQYPVLEHSHQDRSDLPGGYGQHVAFHRIASPAQPRDLVRRIRGAASLDGHARLQEFRECHGGEFRPGAQRRRCGRG